MEALTGALCVRASGAKRGYRREYVLLCRGEDANLSKAKKSLELAEHIGLRIMHLEAKVFIKGHGQGFFILCGYFLQVFDCGGKRETRSLDR